MNRRDALKQMGLLAGGALANRIVQAAASGAVGYTMPVDSALNEEQRTMVAQLAELIIPRTDTPGAADAGVPAFIDQVVSGWYTPVERALFLEGLNRLDAFAGRHFSRHFTRCAAEQQAEALSDEEDRASEYRTGPVFGILDAPDEHSPFFFKIKELTVLGYYTSEVGATQELSYNPVPGRYEGDFDFDKINRQWSS